MCSQDLPDTQRARDEIYSQEIEHDNVWGRLFATKEKFISVDLSENEYSIGRAADCSIRITDFEVKEEVLKTISKLHCKIVRSDSNKPTSAVYLEDYSFNGTFVNNEKVGKDKKRLLKNNDHISLASNRFKVYVYVDASDENMNYPEEIRSRYIVTRELGAGACGKVYLVFEKKSCQRYAMKVVQKNKFDSVRGHNKNKSDKVMNEVKILKALKHPCVISVEDIVDTPNTLYIILELMEAGELFDRIQNCKQLSEPEAKLIFYQIVQAVKYLHDNKITHRDLKLENILLSSDERETLIKVSDFGLSKFIDSQSMLKTFCGTPQYVAPEILETEGRGSYTKEVDIWSMGIILFICLGGYPPFSPEYTRFSLREQIVKGTYSFPPRYWSGVSADCIDLIKKMLTVDPKKRISIDGVLCHSWMQDKVMKKKVHNLIKEGEKSIQENTIPEDDGPPPSKQLKLDEECTLLS